MEVELSALKGNFDRRTAVLQKEVSLQKVSATKSINHKWYRFRALGDCSGLEGPVKIKNIDQFLI